MSKPLILVMTAAGKTGSEVAAQLRAQEWPVRALVRTDDVRAERLRQLGAEVVVGDYRDPERMAPALKGVSRAYYCTPFDPFAIQGAAAFVLAARSSDLESVVAMSQWLASPSHPALATRQHWMADQLLEGLPNVGLTLLTPGLFTEYPYLMLTKYAAHLGVFPLPLDAESRNAPLPTPTSHEWRSWPSPTRGRTRAGLIARRDRSCCPSAR